MGWNGSGGRSGPVRNGPQGKTRGARPRKAAYLALAAAVLAVGAAILLLRTGERDEGPVRESVRPKARPPVVSTNRASAVGSSLPTVAKGPRDRYDGAKVLSAETNSSGTVMIDYELADGSRITRKILPPPIFSNACDQAIAMIVTSGNRRRIPPLPPLNEARVRQAFQDGLLAPIRVSEQDSPRVAALKLAVRDIRSSIGENIRNGDDRSIVKMIQDHVNAHNANIQLRADAVAELKKACENATPDEQRAYLDAVNGHLDKLGVDRIETLHGSRPNNKENTPK